MPEMTAAQITAQLASLTIGDETEISGVTVKRTGYSSFQVTGDGIIGEFQGRGTTASRLLQSI